MQREAADIRDEWLGPALSTLPADRPAAEAAISGLYRIAGLGPPRFHWVSSPLMALETVPPGARLRPPPPAGRVNEWPVTRLLKAARASLTLDLDDRVRNRHRCLAELFHTDVRLSLQRATDRSLSVVLMAAHDSRVRRDWHAVQCPSWVAFYDAIRRSAGGAFTAEQNRRLDLWATVVRSCGWWWPGEDVCVVSERPGVLCVEGTGDGGEVRLHSADGPAVRFADGWELYFWHGTRVPGWVLTDPDVERIEREDNVEVRRCAIERIGWGDYIERAGLRLVASAPDPGNPGTELRLYDMRRESRVLLAVNGSLERDGSRRRYGLTVPGSLADPVAAAGWTYGLSAEQYSLLARRT